MFDNNFQYDLFGKVTHCAGNCWSGLIVEPRW